MYHFMCFAIIYVDSAYQTSQQKNIDINILRSLLVRPLSYWRSASNNTRLLLECKSINIWPTIQMFYLIFCSTHFLLIFFQYTFFSNYFFLQYTFFSNYLFSVHIRPRRIYTRLPLHPDRYHGLPHPTATCLIRLLLHVWLVLIFVTRCQNN